MTAIPRLGLRPGIWRLPISGLGCVAGAAGAAGAAALGRLHDYLLTLIQASQTSCFEI